MSIKGLDSLMRKLDSLGGDSAKVLEKSIDDCTVFVRDDARLRCPVDTGDLRQSILSETESKGGVITGEVFTNMEYAAYVEFGTGTVGEESSYPAKGLNLSYRQGSWSYYSDKLERWVTSTGIKSQPFMYPALHDNKAKLQKKICSDTRKEIKKYEVK